MMSHEVGGGCDWFGRRRAYWGQRLALALAGTAFFFGSHATAAPGDFVLTFTKTRPVGEFCGETDNYVRIHHQGTLDLIAQSNDKMDTDDQTFCIGCPDGLRLVQNLVTVGATRDPGTLVGAFTMELRDAGDFVCADGQIDFVPGPATTLDFQVDFINGTFSTLNTDVQQDQTGEFCITNFPGGSGLCWLAAVETLPHGTLTCDGTSSCGLVEDQSGFVVEELPGVFVSQLDNPRVSSFLALGPGLQGFRGRAEGRELSSTFGFQVELTKTFVGTNGVTFVDGPSPNLTYVVNRSQEEVSTNIEGTGSLYIEGDTMPFESAGISLMHTAQTLQWTSLPLGPGGPGAPGPVIESQSWRVHDDTIIVPVDVIELFRDSEDAPRGGIELARALVDDPIGLPSSPPQQSVHGLLLDVQEEFPRVPAGTGGLDLDLVDQFLRPDGIYAQCGIQFRLRSYLSIQIPDVIYDEGGEMAAGSTSTVPGCLLDFHDDFNGAEECMGPVGVGNGCSAMSSDPRLSFGDGIQDLATELPRQDLIAGVSTTGMFGSVRLPV
jgi:hypothetical protein